jgi:hypothetical protein
MNMCSKGSEEERDDEKATKAETKNGMKVDPWRMWPCYLSYG